LTFHQSGWPQEVVDAECAFGIGFSNCLYAARHVEVLSRGQRLAFDTDKALDQESLPVLSAPDAPSGRTIVALDGVDLPRLDERIARIVRGFPVKVVYNGDVLPRSHCEATRRFHRTPIGLIRIAGEFDGQCTRAAAWYLQGLLVGDCDYYCDNERLNIVHLDSTRFMARLPDRRTLIDADEQRGVIDRAIAALWRDVLVARRLELDADSFSDRFWEAARHFGHAGLFNDLPVLPRQVCREIVGYPTHGDQRHLQEPPRPIRREDIESGEVRVVDEASFEDDDFVALMYLRANGYVMVRSWELGEGHWVHQHLLSLEDVRFDVGPCGQVVEAEFEGRWVYSTVAFCDAVAITCREDQVTIRDDAVWDGNRILYPREACGGDVVGQASSYVDEDDRVREDDRVADTVALADLARRMRCPDPLEALNSLLGELRLERYPQLVGKAFRVAIGANDRDHHVELVA
jgi:hypothetical protein